MKRDRLGRLMAGAVVAILITGPLVYRRPWVQPLPDVDLTPDVKVVRRADVEPGSGTDRRLRILLSPHLDWTHAVAVDAACALAPKLSRDTESPVRPKAVRSITTPGRAAGERPRRGGALSSAQYLAGYDSEGA